MKLLAHKLDEQTLIMAPPHHTLQSQEQEQLIPEEEEERQDFSACGRYNDTISSLHKSPHWNQISHFCQYQGFHYEEFAVEGIIWTQKHFKPKQDDVLLSSFPKCGTTWIKALTSAITNRKLLHPSSSSSSSHPLLHTSPHHCVPYLEFIAHELNPSSLLHSLPSSPRLLSTHMSYTSLPQSILSPSSGTRIVYVCRNPKDVFVSFYKFELNKLRSNNHRGSLIVPLEEAFEMFCNGVSFAGPFWEHVLGYYEASLRHPHRILFLRYEDMKRDNGGCIERLARFMGVPISEEEKSEGVVEEIMKLCSMENLSNLEVNKNGTIKVRCLKEELENNVFFRKGNIGDSKNYLTQEMIRRLDQITEQKLGASGLKL